MSTVVYARSTVWVSRTVQLVRGEAWASDDPVVAANPDQFDSDPEAAGVLRRSVPAAPAVEQATAAPGERRSRPPNIRG